MASRSRTSSPPPVHGADPANETFETLNPGVEFDLPPLEDLSGAVDKEDFDKSAPILVMDMDIPTLRSVAKIGGNPQIKTRRNKALEIGLRTIEKSHLLSSGLATRRLFMQVFPAELELLDDLFTRAQARKRKYDDPGYRLMIEDYQILLRVLFSRKSAAEDSFRMAGKNPPPLPLWGADDDLEFYSLNDFEILAVCFRAEVENFLYTLDRYHDFLAGKPQDASRGVMHAAE
jgi:hypothetical protein